MNKRYVVFILLIGIFLLGFFLRTYDVNWDNNAHLHPDERAIIMYTLPLHFPTSLHEFFQQTSSWNPHFFAYGSLPLYLLREVSDTLGTWYPQVRTYDGITILGRFLSALFDTGTLLIIFFLGKKLGGKTLGLLSAFIYCTCVLPIQLSHFYAVDIPLTFFITLTILCLIHWYEKPTILRALAIGISFGAALATKTSATALIAAVFTALSADFLLVFLRQPHKPHLWTPYAKRLFTTLCTDGVIIALGTICIFLILEPYALIDFQEFWTQTLQQSVMTNNPFIFPYTLQYALKIPYVYEFQQIFFWGVGPIIGIVVLMGHLRILQIIFQKQKQSPWAQEAIIALFVLSYFLVVGKFAVGWIRYMLPLYPFFAIAAGYGLLTLRTFLFRESKVIAISITSILLSGIILWPLSFLSIYTQPHTRIQATQWIYANIPPGSTIAVEHWDDPLPLGDAHMYSVETLKLYDPDTPEKWSEINAQLARTQYIILSSNRLYVPLQKLTDCSKLPSYRCYPTTAAYYQKLFHGQLGFTKIAEFAVYPTIPLLNIPINDQSADESFTVYDHPKVIIFKKTP